MKQLSAVPATSVNTALHRGRARDDFRAAVEAASNLPPGQFLPFECEDVKEAASLASHVRYARKKSRAAYQHRNVVYIATGPASEDA